MAQLVSASDTSQKILSSNSTTSVNKYFDSSSQRLQRYIADIQKGFVIIVVAGVFRTLSPLSAISDSGICTIVPYEPNSGAVPSQDL